MYEHSPVNDTALFSLAVVIDEAPTQNMNGDSDQMDMMQAK